MEGLSAYEQKRYLRIKRNEARLRELGLSTNGGPSTSTAIPTALRPKRVKSIRPKPKPKLRAPKRKRPPSQPTRRSSRLRRSPSEADAERQTSKLEATAPVVAVFSYERMPIEVDDVDDLEFLAFAALKRWRLLRSRELELEAYKVFQNRTLLELVRRRRNDATWALEATHEERMETALEVWGVGPSKAMEGGFAAEALVELNRASVDALISRSRAEAPEKSSGVEGE